MATLLPIAIYDQPTTISLHICTSLHKFLLWNARSLSNQIHNFQSYIYSRDYDIITITETWLSNHINTNKLIPHGYNVSRKDRDGRGGGVLLAFKDKIPIKELSTPIELEVLSAEIIGDNVTSNLINCLIYRPSNFTEQYNTSLLTYLNSVNNLSDLLIIGDLNLPEVDWNIYNGNTNDYFKL